MINTTTISCCPHTRKRIQKEVQDCSRQTSVQESLEIKMNAKLQAGKDAVKSFPKELLQNCRGCQLTGFAVAPHDKPSPWFCHTGSSCSKQQCLCPTPLPYCLAPLAHGWVFRNPAIAGDTFQLSALLKSEPTLMTRTAYKEGFKTAAWPPLEAEAD